MKKLSILIIALFAAFNFTACSEDDDIVFIAQPDPEGIAFTATLQGSYILTAATSDNLAERFVWNAVDFGTPTTITYQVQGAANPEFNEFTLIGETGETNLGVTVGKFMTLATEAGLDNDPSTEAPNMGSIYFRVRAYAGSDGGNVLEEYSEALELNVELLEAAEEDTGYSVSSWGVVGSGANDWGSAGPDLPFYTTDEAGILVAYVNLKDGFIKFRENNSWDNNFGDTGVDGVLDAGGDDIAVTAGDYKITFNTNDNTYSIEAYSWGIIGSAYNDWGNDGPDAKLFYDYTTNTFKGGVKLLEGEMKVRLNNDWGINYGDTGADGTLDQDGDNIVVTAGFYAVTLDLANNMITVEPASLWGIVGDGYNAWGETPDFMFTEIHEGIWLAQNVTLIDGFIKFRVNEDWGANYGDTGVDGILDDGGDDIAVTAGTYDIYLDFTDATAPTYTMITK